MKLHGKLNKYSKNLVFDPGMKKRNYCRRIFDNETWDLSQFKIPQVN